MKKITYLKSAFLVVMVLFMASCLSDLEKYYQTPDWLKGNSWEVLEKKGNFKMFLSAVEKTSYKDLVQGKGIITVMAPTDSAFQVYLTKHGYSSIDDIPANTLNTLVGYHLVFYSFDKEGFEAYNPFGRESELRNKGLYYKFRTKSRDSISVRLDPAENNAPRKVMHKDRFLPVFSYNYFNLFRIDAKASYEYFYPESTWTGANGFNVSNASVKEYAIISDNGYVYVVNQVIEPLETIYGTLSKEPGFSAFKNAYDRFITFEYDPTATTEYGNGDSLYIMYHGSELPPIASEWTNDLGVTNDYAQLSMLAANAHTLFAPDNAAMQSFFDKYWSAYYTSLDSVRFEPLLALMRNHVCSGQVLFPQQLETGLIKTKFGNLIQFNRADVKAKSICVNGAMYGMNNVMVPPMFEKVTAPMYCDPKYTIFLDMVINSGYLQSLILNNTSFKVFYPKDEIITVNTNIEGRAIQYQNTNSKRYGAQEVQIYGDLDYIPMSNSTKKTFAGAHIATELISTKGDEAIYRTMNAYNYLYIKGDKVYSSALYNIKAPEKVPTFTKINGNWNNGDAYALSGEYASALVPETNQFKAMITSVASPTEFTYFKYTIQAAGMDKTSPPFSFLQGERFIVLIPKDDAIYNGMLKGKVPMSPATAVSKYLTRYFVNVGSSNLLDYPFAGSGINSEVVTFATNTAGAPVKYTIIDKSGELYVRDAKGNEVKVLSYFPYIYADGAAYLIDGLLESE